MQDHFQDLYVTTNRNPADQFQPIKCKLPDNAKEPSLKRQLEYTSNVY